MAYPFEGLFGIPAFVWGVLGAGATGAIAGVDSDMSCAAEMELSVVWSGALVDGLVLARGGGLDGAMSRVSGFVGSVIVGGARTAGSTVVGRDANVGTLFDGVSTGGLDDGVGVVAKALLVVIGAGGVSALVTAELVSEVASGFAVGALVLTGAEITICLYSFLGGTGGGFVAAAVLGSGSGLGLVEGI
jgi:hypothetical protein